MHFIYDQSGQLIAEIDAATGQTLREYIYVNGQQIALVDDTDSPDEAVYFVHNDHLGTPQKISDESQVVVWDAVYQPFGEVEIVSDVVENNLRFPGQYADSESGLHYNYFRDYDSSLGRYIESDPIGLRGGNNLFLYALGNPLSNSDLFGLMPATSGRLFGFLQYYLKKEVGNPAKIVKANAISRWNCIECEVTCLAEFATPGLMDLAQFSVDSYAKLVANESAKIGIKQISNRIFRSIKIYKSFVAVSCVLNCQ